MKPKASRPLLQIVTAMAIASTLPPTAKWVAVVIASHMNRVTGEAFPSDACIARETGYSERTVRDAVHVILDSGILRAKRGGSLTGGKRQSTRYWVGTPEEVSPVKSSNPGRKFPGAKRGPRKEVPQSKATTPETVSNDPGNCFHQTPEAASGKPMNGRTNEMNHGNEPGRKPEEVEAGIRRVQDIERRLRRVA